MCWRAASKWCYQKIYMNQPEIGQPAPDAAFLDRAGRASRLSDFWRAQPTVLVFLRHFG